MNTAASGVCHIFVLLPVAHCPPACHRDSSRLRTFTCTLNPEREWSPRTNAASPESVLKAIITAPVFARSPWRVVLPVSVAARFAPVRLPRARPRSLSGDGGPPPARGGASLVSVAHVFFYVKADGDMAGLQVYLMLSSRRSLS